MAAVQAAADEECRRVFQQGLAADLSAAAADRAAALHWLHESEQYSIGDAQGTGSANQALVRGQGAVGRPARPAAAATAAALPASGVGGQSGAAADAALSASQGGQRRRPPQSRQQCTDENAGRYTGRFLTLQAKHKLTQQELSDQQAESAALRAEKQRAEASLHAAKEGLAAKEQQRLAAVQDADSARAECWGLRQQLQQRAAELEQERSMCSVLSAQGAAQRAATATAAEEREAAHSRQIAEQEAVHSRQRQQLDAAHSQQRETQEELAATQGVMQQLQTTVQRLEQGTAALETQLAQAHEQIGRNELALFDANCRTEQAMREHAEVQPHCQSLERTASHSTAEAGALRQQLVLRDAHIRELERAHSEMRGRLQAALRRAAALNSAALAGSAEGAHWQSQALRQVVQINDEQELRLEAAAERIAELTSCLEDAPTPAMLASLEQRLAAKTREAELLAAARSSSSGANSGSGGSSSGSASGSGASASNSSGDGASAAAELDAAKRQIEHLLKCRNACTCLEGMASEMNLDGDSASDSLWLC